LPSAIAKNGSGRRIYVLATVLREVWDYIHFDLAELIEQARRRGAYDRLPSKLLVEDPTHAAIAPHADGGRRRPVETLSPRQRRRLFVCSAEGLEPASLWLNRHGLPVMPGTWRSMFGDANDRCRRHEVGLHPDAHYRKPGVQATARTGGRVGRPQRPTNAVTIPNPALT
jgi:hypothetical protein